jgi:hypothetical protein
MAVPTTTRPTDAAGVQASVITTKSNKTGQIILIVLACLGTIALLALGIQASNTPKHKPLTLADLPVTPTTVAGHPPRGSGVIDNQIVLPGTPLTQRVTGAEPIAVGSINDSEQAAAQQSMALVQHFLCTGDSSYLDRFTAFPQLKQYWAGHQIPLCKPLPVTFVGGTRPARDLVVATINWCTVEYYGDTVDKCHQLEVKFKLQGGDWTLYEQVPIKSL